MNDSLRMIGVDLFGNDFNDLRIINEYVFFEDVEEEFVEIVDVWAFSWEATPLLYERFIFGACSLGNGQFIEGVHGNRALG